MIERVRPLADRFGVGQARWAPTSFANTCQSKELTKIINRLRIAPKALRLDMTYVMFHSERTLREIGSRSRENVQAGANMRSGSIVMDQTKNC